MQLIPVLDLMEGRVVHARAGDRANYRPLESALCAGSEPLALARALLQMAPFTQLYVADLDAIMHQGQRRHDDALLRELCSLVGRVHGELWLDAGWFDGGHAPWRAPLAQAARERGARLCWVVGSESLDARSLCAPACRDVHDVLSLDSRGGQALGPASLHGDARQWPTRVIVMELGVVGSDRGPAMEALQRLRAVADAGGRRDVQLFAAGGVRGIADLRALEASGAAGALVASALHDGRLDAAALQELLGNARTGSGVGRPRTRGRASPR